MALRIDRLPMKLKAILVASLACTWPSLGAPAKSVNARPSVANLSAQVDQIAAQLKNADDNLRVVETQYSNAPEPTDEEAYGRRFSEGEIQYLLGQYANAAVLFYDLISDKNFAQNTKYQDALFYLSDALYQQNNFTGSKWYLLMLLKTRGPRQREALARFIEISGKLNEFSDVEEYVPSVRNANGALPPEIAYLYGKWLFHRTDVPLADRMKRAAEVFGPLATSPKGPYRLQADYFMGVGNVKQRDFAAALMHFERIVQSKANNPKEQEIRELASLALGRVLFEMGRFDEAVDRYQDIPRESEHFANAMYEVAWTHVKKGEFKKALNAADVLALLSQGTTLEPEVTLLQAHLQLKLKRYTEATDTYRFVSDAYRPVRDEIEDVLKVHRDPVKYFDELLARNAANLDVTELLPPVALKWATTQEDVSRAISVVNDLEVGRKNVADSAQLAEELLSTLEKRGLEAFPALQEGYIRADAVESALTRIDQTIVLVESELVDDKLHAEARTTLEKLKAEQAALQSRFDTLPRNQDEVKARRERLQARVAEVDQAAFKLEYEVQSLFAVITALDKWLTDTRSMRRDQPQEEAAFVDKMKAELATLNMLQNELQRLRRQLQEERAAADAALTGEAQLRAQFGQTLKQQYEVIQSVEAQLPPDATQLRKRLEQLRARAADIQARAVLAKSKLRARLGERGKKIRDAIVAEQMLLTQYSNENAFISSEARNLVGKIVVDSFDRVRKQFYDLVLKADVGLVDVAFTRKQDKTAEIQQLANQKDKELQILDSEFQEVLKDVE